ncbi:hypothetical protein ISF_05889 [Cordyceps fumosorosea ARSEF 2679]|uniref:Uncharacterized protein n=1 Tax=Cordyceps fumosorosea (strain ARSEF 2679) TaxID=1081104 RepID=A0A167TQT3_CORFA|nr:hypothetical protein ISF_05889 [Cordyceps fumosorosea ARSEF 2679]OAA60850.1 hypothetical protein ISF_05889 [Cordyceps fumosorosea ARSEF 2679]
MSPMSSIRQYGAPDLLTLTYCRTAMLARDLFGGYQPSGVNAWDLKSWGDVINDDLHRVLDVVALPPSHVQQSDLIAVHPYDGTARLNFERQHEQLSALVQGLYAAQAFREHFPQWVTQPYGMLSSPCADGDVACISVEACQRLAPFLARADDLIHKE